MFDNKAFDFVMTVFIGLAVLGGITLAAGLLSLIYWIFTHVRFI